VELGTSRLKLCVPRSLYSTRAKAALAFERSRIPLVFAEKELGPLNFETLKIQVPRLVCESFLDALSAMAGGMFATILPDYLARAPHITKGCITLEVGNSRLDYRLAWNPRLMRLNPAAIRRRDFLRDLLHKSMAEPQS